MWISFFLVSAQNTLFGGWSHKSFPIKFPGAHVNMYVPPVYSTRALLFIFFVHYFVLKNSPQGDRLEYLHHSPVSCGRQWKRKPCTWGNNWVTLSLGDRDLVLQVGGSMQGWWPCSVKKLMLWNPKWKLTEASKEGYGSKALFCRWWWWWWWW
jgi:hypothetical protein